MSSPRVFISYSTQIPEHQKWVRELDAVLRKSGIDTKLDVFDLHPGDPMDLFMDELREYNYIVVVGDRSYSYRAAHYPYSGVGYEARLIRELLEEEGSKGRVVPIYTEYDEAGLPALPTFLQGCFSIDFTEAQAYETSIAKLLIHLIGASLYNRVEIGTLPDVAKLQEIAQRHRTRMLTDQMPILNLKKFVGRKTELHDLHTRLTEEHQVVLVNGMGGLGKTALAQAYLQYYKTTYAYIAWIDLGAAHSDLLLSITNSEGLMQNLNLPSLEGESLKDRMPYCTYLPQQPNWHILATARTVLEHFEPYTLDFLSSQDCVALFNLHYTRKDANGNPALSNHFLHALVEKLQYHTLTIEILAKIVQKYRYKEADLNEALSRDLPARVYIPTAAKKLYNSPAT